jgi:hypothetical protein
MAHFLTAFNTFSVQKKPFFIKIILHLMSLSEYLSQNNSFLYDDDVLPENTCIMITRGSPGY